MSIKSAFIPQVRPSSAIRTDYRAFSALAHETNEPIVVTNNGEADLIVMSPQAYNAREARYQLEDKLLEGDRSIVAGDLLDHDTFMNQLRSRLSSVE